MPPSSHAFNLSALVNLAATPVVLITATAILLSGFSAKYGNISDRLRSLTAEHRHADTLQARRLVLRFQIRIFRQRVSMMWAASACLSSALLLFVGTVLSVIFSERAVHLGLAGAAFLVTGLALIGIAITLELYELRLARLAVDGELADIFPDG